MTMKGIESIGEQLRRNTVALISLVAAISSLAYNTWRNVPRSAEQLYATWEAEWSDLGPDTDSYRRVVEAVETVRHDTHDLLVDLD